MNCRHLIALVLTCLASRSAVSQDLPVAKPEQAGFSSAALARVVDVMQQRVDQKMRPGGVVAVARQGKLVLLEAVTKEGEDLVKKDSIVRLYSMSKAITTAAAMILVDEGKVALDEAVAKEKEECGSWRLLHTWRRYAFPI